MTNTTEKLWTYTGTNGSGGGEQPLRVNLAAEQITPSILPHTIHAASQSS